jgi:hypothetical protein
MRKLFGHYRPELHYMRGPGPKWLEKHGRTDRTGPDANDRGGNTFRPIEGVAPSHRNRPLRNWPFRSRIDE